MVLLSPYKWPLPHNISLVAAVRAVVSGKYYLMRAVYVGRSHSHLVFSVLDLACGAQHIPGTQYLEHLKLCRVKVGEKKKKRSMVRKHNIYKYPDIIMLHQTRRDPLSIWTEDYSPESGCSWKKWERNWHRSLPLLLQVHYIHYTYTNKYLCMYYIMNGMSNVFGRAGEQL